MTEQILLVLAWLAAPVTLIAALDSWFLQPRRRTHTPPLPDPAFMQLVYLVWPILLVAVIVHVMLSERVDFSLVLVVVAAVSGLVWLIDRLWFAAGRRRAAVASGLDPAAQPLPLTVDYARSFFPVALVVLLVRSFIFEPFRIPSDSMMPTLQDGDFIVVNKFAYGLRLPVLDTKFLNIGEPQRGDVVVFHYPVDPSVNFIKRAVGLPGDRVRVVSGQLIINGVPVPLTSDGIYDDGCYHNMHLSTEVLGTHRHQTLSCHSPHGISRVDPGPSCDRNIELNYVCVEPAEHTEPDLNDRDELHEMVVPEGQYLMIGDNRDNSLDGRFWGFVPEDHLVGRANHIWMNAKLKLGWPPLRIKWSRIGARIG